MRSSGLWGGFPSYIVVLLLVVMAEVFNTLFTQDGTSKDFSVGVCVCDVVSLD